MNLSNIHNLLNLIPGVGLDELDKVRLMDRIDTKYVFSFLILPDLLKMLKEDYRILEINGERIFTYNTIYFDTLDHRFYFEHVKGRSVRHKIRFRQYEISGITFLEIKEKTKKNRTIKWRIRHDEDVKVSDETAMKFISDHLQIKPQELSPVLRNRFKRITLTGKNNPERITIDIDLSFLTPDGLKAAIPSVVIAELKSPGLPSRSPFYRLMKEFSVRPTGFSKYCIGNAILLNLPGKNILKSKLRLLNKIENEYKQSGAA